MALFEAPSKTMKRRGFITWILAALGVGLSTGIRPASVEGEAEVPDAPPAPPTDLLAGRCYACLDTGWVYVLGTGEALPCHVCSGTPCPRCGGHGEIPVAGSLGDMSRYMGYRSDGNIPSSEGLVYDSRPCPRCSVPVTHYPRKYL